MELLGVLGFALLLVNLAAHVANVAAFARSSAARAALGLAVPPLGALWAWEAGARRRVAVWAASLAGFALVVIVATHVR
jgi:hypothetical protein